MNKYCNMLRKLTVKESAESSVTTSSFCHLGELTRRRDPNFDFCLSPSVSRIPPPFASISCGKLANSTSWSNWFEHFAKPDTEKPKYTSNILEKQTKFVFTFVKSPNADLLLAVCIVSPTAGASTAFRFVWCPGKKFSYKKSNKKLKKKIISN